MPGTAIVTINDNQWNVEVVTTTSELITGLSGRASIPAGTGMLFILPARQLVSVDTSQMLFGIDIIFIKDNIVLSIASNILPGYLVEEATPIDMFLEVNALEAALVEVGDVVNIEITTIQEPAFDWSNIISFAIPLAVLGFIGGMVGGMLGGSSHSGNPKGYYPKTDVEWERLGECIVKKDPNISPEVVGGYVADATATIFTWYKGEERRKALDERQYARDRLLELGRGTGCLGSVRRLGEPRTEEERAGVHKEFYGAEGLSPRGMGLGERGESEEGRRLGEPKTEAERKETHLAKYGSEELPEKGSGRDKYYLVKTEYPTIEIGVPSAGRELRANRVFIIIKDYPGITFTDIWTTSKLSMLEVDEALGKLEREGYIRKEEQHSISGEPRRRLVEEYGSWAVGRAEAICPEDDVACVTREAKRLIGTLRSRYGEAAMEYVTITDAGATVFHPGDVVSVIAMERENRRVRELGEREATWSA